MTFEYQIFEEYENSYYAKVYIVGKPSASHIKCSGWPYFERIKGILPALNTMQHISARRTSLLKPRSSPATSYCSTLAHRSSWWKGQFYGFSGHWSGATLRSKRFGQRKPVPNLIIFGICKEVREFVRWYLKGLHFKLAGKANRSVCFWGNRMRDGTKQVQKLWPTFVERRNRSVPATLNELLQRSDPLQPAASWDFSSTKHKLLPLMLTKAGRRTV